VDGTLHVDGVATLASVVCEGEFKQGDMKMWSFVDDTFADDETLDLPDATMGMLLITFDDGTHCIGGACIVTDAGLVYADSMYGPYGNTNLFAWSDTDTKYCIYQSGTNVRIKNRIGSACKLRVTYFYN
jgi:hypothetical protein